MVKILGDTACSGTNTGGTPAGWTGNLPSSTPGDCAITSFVQLPETTTTISAMAVDGADNLWVRTCPLLRRKPAPDLLHFPRCVLRAVYWHTLHDGAWTP